MIPKKYFSVISLTLAIAMTFGQTAAVFADTTTDTGTGTSTSTPQTQVVVQDDVTTTPDSTTTPSVIVDTSTTTDVVIDATSTSTSTDPVITSTSTATTTDTSIATTTTDTTTVTTDTMPPTPQPMSLSVQIFSPTKTINWVKLNGATSTTVSPGQSFTVTVNATVYTGDQVWHSTSYKIGNMTWVCVNTSNDSNGTFTETFSRNAPTTVAIYDFSVRIHKDQNCFGDTSTTYTLKNGLNVSKTNPALTWNKPADITYGTSLSTTTQLNAVAKDPSTSVTLPGIYTYKNASGTVVTNDTILNAGAAQTLTVSFVPTDSTTYNNAYGTTTINVNKANQTIHWGALANIVQGTPISSSTQLNATVSVVGPAPAGALTYDTASGTILSVGTHTLNATSSATNSYNLATSSVSLKVVPGPATQAFIATDATTTEAPGNIHITVTVKDANGNLVADGTAVAFSSDFGTLSGSATTTSGIVNLTLNGTSVRIAHFSISGISTVTGVTSVSFVDTTAPVITIHGSTPVSIQVHNTYVDAGASSTDAVDGDISAGIIASSTVNTEALGTYTVTYTSTDSHENSTSSVRTVNVIDTTAPVITILGSNPVQVEAGTTYTDAQATANDNYNGDLTSDIVASSTVNTAVIGDYSVTYTVVDTSGNGATSTRIVNVRDTIAPSLTLNGSSTITLEVGSTFTDPGATASDSFDTSVSSSSVEVTGTVNTSVVGTYPLIYSVSDASGNTSTTSRIVNIIDTTAPVITILGSNPVQVEAGTTYTDAQATSTDNYDGDITSKIVASSSVDTAIIGDYSVVYMVVDTSGNGATSTRIVNVRDTIAPVLTLLGDNPMTVNVGTEFTDPGATTTDSFDTGVTNESIHETGSVDSSKIGSYILTYTVSDTSGNTSSSTRTVNVVDTTAPVITVLGSNPVQVEAGTTYTDAQATSTDNYDGEITSKIVASSTVNTAATGTYEVVYTVKDSSGNEASSTRTVTVADTLPPTLTLIGSSTITIKIGHEFTDPGATASDSFDTSVSSSSVVASGTVNTSVVGTYTIDYSVSDASGNTATTSRTVNVIPLSSNSALSALAVSQGTLSPSFSSETLTYNVLLPYGSTITPVTTSTTSDPNATSTKVNASNVASATTSDRTTTVTVRAENGENTTTYSVIFTVASSQAITPVITGGGGGGSSSSGSYLPGFGGSNNSAPGSNGPTFPNPLAGIIPTAFAAGLGTTTQGGPSATGIGTTSPEGTGGNTNSNNGNNNANLAAAAGNLPISPAVWVILIVLLLLLLGAAFMYWRTTRSQNNIQ